MTVALPLPFAGALAMLGVCACAALWGRTSSRRAAVFVAAAFAAAWIARSLLPAGLGMATALAIDMGLLVALATLAWKPQRSWPLILVALQGLVVALDILRGLEPGVRASSFALAFDLVGMAVAATLIYAAASVGRDDDCSS